MIHTRSDLNYTERHQINLNDGKQQFVDDDHDDVAASTE